MTQDITTLIDIIDNFHENYNAEIIEEYPTNFSNDTLLIIQEVKKIGLSNSNDIFKKIYADYITSILNYESVLKEHFEFDFTTIKTLEELDKNEAIASVEPSFVHYSFGEVEGIIEQMFDELKNIKESQAELKEEIGYLLEDYVYHIEYLEENIQYNYYIYDDLKAIDDVAEIERLKEEKMKLYEKFEQKLQAKK